ncbi:unnamed protein product [Adineta ricciae]|uniref:Glutamate--cysteine ligase n=1 Tax=Adineta ricciae TaxID=249248 RepID=A0A815CT79_ADIRI|nr:unnamed protein product [Adineta ricciae]
MGLLTKGNPLSWNDIVLIREKIHMAALVELLQIFELNKDRQGDSFMWGDELDLIIQINIFKSLVLNISERRQSRTFISIPIFRDTATPSPFCDVTFENKSNIIDDHIHLDSSMAGLGCCCIQVIFQAESLKENLKLHDELLPLTRIM